MKELETGFKEAKSFPGLNPPNNATLLGKIQTPKDIVNIYKDSQGNYWYDTENGRKFEMDMQERIKKREEEKKRNRRRGKIA